jgi:hypothetical protein
MAVAALVPECDGQMTWVSREDVRAWRGARILDPGEDPTEC